MQATIRIANPEPGGKLYTSGKRALEYIKAGRAVLLDDGSLFFAERRDADPYMRIIGNAAGKEWAGTPSGKGGPSVIQLAPLRDRGIRQIQRKRGMEPCDPTRN